MNECIEHMVSTLLEGWPVRRVVDTLVETVSTMHTSPDLTHAPHKLSVSWGLGWRRGMRRLERLRKKPKMIRLMHYDTDVDR
jgi:hypothetical protein